MKKEILICDNCGEEIQDRYYRVKGVTYAFCNSENYSEIMQKGDYCRICFFNKMKEELDIICRASVRFGKI